MKLFILLFLCIRRLEALDVSLIQGDCPDGQFDDNNGGCLDVVDHLSTVTCPVALQNLPSSGAPSCTAMNEYWYYIHVGGSDTIWTEGTDAVCLSVHRTLAVWGEAPCQLARSEEACQQMLLANGCIVHIQFTIHQMSVIERTTTEVHHSEVNPSVNVDVSLIQGDCPTGLFDHGYEGCLDVVDHLSSVTCPISAENPPPTEAPSCTPMNEHLYYIHVGGTGTIWTEGTDAVCLSIYRTLALWGEGPCQLARSYEACQQMLVANGCMEQKQFTLPQISIIERTTQVRGHNSDVNIDVSLIQGDCPAGQFDHGYDGCLDVVGHLSPFTCPVSTENPPPTGAPSCTPMNEYWYYIHVGGTDTIWAEDGDAVCLSIDRTLVVWGERPCQLAPSFAACLQMLLANGCMEEFVVPETSRTTTEANIFNNDEEPNVNIDVSLIQGSCPDGQFYSGYEQAGCLDVARHVSATTCPLSLTNPPAGGSASCKAMGEHAFYIHVGGMDSEWNDGTDAMCLSVFRTVVAWGGRPCQIAPSEPACIQLLVANGCISGHPFPRPTPARITIDPNSGNVQVVPNPEHNDSASSREAGDAPGVPNEEQLLGTATMIRAQFSFLLLLSILHFWW